MLVGGRIILNPIRRTRLRILARRRRPLPVASVPPCAGARTSVRPMDVGTLEPWKLIGAQGKMGTVPFPARPDMIKPKGGGLLTYLSLISMIKPT